MIWLYQFADWDSANDTLASFSSKALTSNDDMSISELWNTWYDFFMTTIRIFIPTRRIKTCNNIPYLFRDLCRLIRKKNKLYCSAEKLHTTFAWSKYNHFRNHVTSALRSAKYRYLKFLADKLNSPRDFWKSYHKLSDKSSCISGDLYLGEASESSTLGKANLLNKIFHLLFYSTLQQYSP